jgi:hypothetical protein
MNMFRNITPLGWIGIIILFNSTILGGASQLGDLSLSPGIVKAILAVATLGNGFLGGLVTMFSGQAAMVKTVAAMPGVQSISVNSEANKTLARIAVSEADDSKKIEATPQAATLVAAIAKSAGMIAIVLVGGLLAFAGDAQAQATPLPKLKPPQITGDVAADTKANFGIKPPSSVTTDGQSPFEKAVTSFNTEVQNIKKEAVTFAITDANAAITDATNHNDQISLPCWQANLKLFQGLPIMWDTPPSEPIGIMLGIQISRDIINSITGNDKDSLKVACAALWGDQAKILLNVGLMLGIKISTGGLF